MRHFTKVVVCTLVVFSHIMLLRGDHAENLTEGSRSKRSIGKLTKKDINSYLPKMVVFDPDMVFWPFVTETDVIPPFGMRSYQPTTAVVGRTKKKTTIAKYGARELVDRNGTVLTIHPEALEVISRFLKKDVKMAIASTSEAIATMRHILHLFDIDHAFSHMEIDLDSPIEHLNLIKNESSIEFHEFIYFGANITVLSAVKRQLNILTVKVNPETGITLLDAYSAIYLFNLRPCVTTKDGKIHILKEFISEEETVTKSSKSNKKVQRKIKKITNQPVVSTKNISLAAIGTNSSAKNTLKNISHSQSNSEQTDSMHLFNEGQITIASKDPSYLQNLSEERTSKIGQCLAGAQPSSADHSESKFYSQSDERPDSIDNQYNNEIKQLTNELESKSKNDDSSAKLLDSSKSNVVMGIETYEQCKDKKIYDNISKEQIIMPTLGPLFHIQYTTIDSIIKTTKRKSKRRKQQKTHSNYSIIVNELLSTTPKVQAKRQITRKKRTKNVKEILLNKTKSTTDRNNNNNDTEYEKRLKPKRVPNRRGRGRTLLLMGDSTTICRRDRGIQRTAKISNLFLKNGSSAADVLKSELEPFPGHLKSVHINAQSLACHIAEIRDVFRFQSSDVIGVSESWLKQSISNDEVSLSGYSLFRNDRFIKKGGGVALYIRKGLRAEVVFASKPSSEEKPELLFVKIEFLSVEILVGICYRQPKIGFMVELEYALMHLMPNYKHILLMGDFNIDLLTDELNYDYNTLTKMLENLKLSLVPLESTHHIAESHTLLDLFAVSDLSRVIHHGQLPVTNISRHDLIFCVISLRDKI